MPVNRHPVQRTSWLVSLRALWTLRPAWDHPHTFLRVWDTVHTVLCIACACSTIEVSLVLVRAHTSRYSMGIELLLCRVAVESGRLAGRPKHV
ncbi:hypothetical protein BD310DRAFT_913797 [Dichomitus squalens]|uniref:Uncharacterized protein n=1 Tax=Dichomitus squalens TaxID=114155 RepID=A0A4Q9QBE6_9APHY|nr:hypothetical protein BD310DRAFT_913797 [Dichomitus squalens]